MLPALTQEHMKRGKIRIRIRSLTKDKDKDDNMLSSLSLFIDIYLVRWLRAVNWNIMEAGVLLLENLRWRKDNKMDTILEEDWSKFEEKFPYFVEGCDKEGRPGKSLSLIIVLDSS